MITIKEAEEILKKEYHLDNYEYLIGEILLPDYKKEEHSVSFKNDIFQLDSVPGDVTRIGSVSEGAGVFMARPDGEKVSVNAQAWSHL